jgi:hypothetical protein
MRKEIYVYLLDEGTDVLRPIEAEYVQEKIYKIIFKNDSKKKRKMGVFYRRLCAM